MKYLLLILSGTAIISCQWIEQQFDYNLSYLSSTLTKNFFSEKQERDVAFLLDNLKHVETCRDLDKVMVNNPTINKLKRIYRLQDDFLYKELISGTIWIPFPITSNEHYIATGVITAWLQTERPTTIKAVIDKVELCWTQSI